MNVSITVNSLDVQIDDVRWKGKLPKIGETINIKAVVPPENYHSYHKYIVEECTEENLNKLSAKLGKLATPWELSPIEKNI